MYHFRGLDQNHVQSDGHDLTVLDCASLLRSIGFDRQFVLTECRVGYFWGFVGQIRPNSVSDRKQKETLNSEICQTS